MAEENGTNTTNSDFGSQENLTADIINLEIEELDDAEYAIPSVEKLPSLESILAEPDDVSSLGGTDDEIANLSLERLTTASETLSIGSLLSLSSPSRPKMKASPSSGVILRHLILKGVSTQIASASEKINAGLASAVAANGNMLAIGTSHGIILNFDAAQTLKWCHRDTKHQGAVSAICFNHDATRILIGFAKGNIIMLDTLNGKILRTLTDVHPPGTAVLHIKFTDSPKLALCSDSGGSVFELSFTRTMGVRGCDSKCLFSGSRGEVCAIEPLLLGDLSNHPLQNYVLVALATLSKVIVVCIRPRMRVVLTHPLNGAPAAPPQVAWQLVVIRSVNGSKIVDPVLALGRDTVIHFYQVCSEPGMRVRLTPLRRIILTYTMSNLRWMNSRSLAVLDIQEKLHLLDVRTQENLETLDISNVGLSYASSHYKGLSTGGNVSKAMALAGERACYNTVITFGSQLLLLGMKSLHAVCIRSWTERICHLTMQKRYKEALHLGLEFYSDKGKAVTGLRGSKQRRKQIIQDKVCQVLNNYMDELSVSNISNNSVVNDDLEIIATCVEYCVQLELTEILFNKLWDLVSENEVCKTTYLRALENPLLEGSLTPQLPPLIAQQLVALFNEENKLESLQSIIILLNVDCLDIHQVTTICKQQGLWEALIHLQTAALGDFTAPIHQLVPILENHLTENNSESTVSWDCINLGNALLVYASCCLTGRQFPRKNELPEGQTRKVKADVLRALLSQHSSLANETEKQYPYLRTLLSFDTKGFLDALAMAFQEPEFTSEMGLRQRQRVVDILFNLVISNSPINNINVNCLTNEQKILVLIFIINEVIEDTVTLESSALFKIAQALCIDTSRENKTKRESALIKLLDSNKLGSISESTVLNLAKQANFLRVLELVYTNRGDWELVCKCLIDDKLRHNEVLPLIQQLPTIQIEQIIKKYSKELIEIDVNTYVNMIITRLPDKINDIINDLNNFPKTKYILLSAFYQIDKEEKVENNKNEENFDNNNFNNKKMSKIKNIKYELNEKDLEDYLKLMCEYNPEKVMNHLRSSYGCSWENALNIVREASRKDAEALLYEQLGDYKNAYDILLSHLKEVLNKDITDENIEKEIASITSQVASLCRRSAGVLDWISLVEIILNLQSNNFKNESKNLGEKLLKIILESLSGTTALSTVLEHILKQPLSTGGTMGDVRQLLTSVLAQTKYEQLLVETTMRLVSLELHDALKKSLRDSAKGHSCNSLSCPICGKSLANTSNYVVVFSCSHTYHVDCLPEQKMCYECLRTNGWAEDVADFSPPPPRPNIKETAEIVEPVFLRNKFPPLKLSPPIPWPDLENIL